MSFFRAVYLAIQSIFGLSATKRSEFCDANIHDIPAFAPSTPVSIGSGDEQHYKPKRQNNTLSGLECTQVGEIIIIECANRSNYRQVTRAIDRVCGARKRGIDHLRKVRMKTVLVHERDIRMIESALKGASYHELRRLAE